MKTLFRNLAITARAVGSQLSEDPARFILLAAQRFPRALTGPVATALDRCGSLGVAYAAWMRGDRAGALAEVRATRHTAGLRLRVAANLAVAADDPATMVLEDYRRPTPALSVLRARSLWQQGDLQGAIASLRGTRSHVGRKYLQMLESELRILTPGYELATASESRPHVHPISPTRSLHILTNSLPHTQSGYTLRSHSILTALHRAGAEVVAATRTGYPVTVGKLRARSLDIVDDIAYHRVLPWRMGATVEARLNQQVRELDKLVEAFRPAVIHTTSNYTNALVAQAVAARHGLPWTYEVRGMLEKTWAASRGTLEAREIAAASERFRIVRAREAELATAASHVFTISDTMRDDLAERGVDRRQISLIPNSIDASLLGSTTAPASARIQLGLASDGFWVGAVSSLVDYEGHDLLVDAVSILRERGLDVRLLLVGEGVARPELLRSAATLGEAAVIPGRVAPDLAKTYVEALDVVVVPRRDLEVTRSVTPLKPMEAMALGRPVVVSALPPLRELVGDDERGLVVAPDSARSIADALAMLIDDAPRRHRLVTAAKQFASSHTWDAVTAEYQRVFAGLRAAS